MLTLLIDLVFKLQQQHLGMLLIIGMLNCLQLPCWVSLVSAEHQVKVPFIVVQSWYGLTQVFLCLFIQILRSLKFRAEIGSLGSVPVPWYVLPGISFKAFTRCKVVTSSKNVFILSPLVFRRLLLQINFVVKITNSFFDWIWCPAIDLGRTEIWVSSCAYISSFVSLILCSITWSIAWFLSIPSFRLMVRFRLREWASLSVSSALSWAWRHMAAKAYFVFPHTLNNSIRNFPMYSVLLPSPSYNESWKSLRRIPVFRMLW